MDAIIIKTHESENTTLEAYLSSAITDYGLAQLQGHVPLKLYCSCTDDAGKLLGAAMGTKTLNMFFISHLFVEAAYRNQQIGSRLLTEIETLAIRHHCNLLRLNTFNKQTSNLYKKAGFKESITIQHYMNGFDLTYYEKSLQ